MASERLAQAYRPSMHSHLRHAMRKFVAFSVDYNINLEGICERDVISYIEYLVIKGFKYKSIVTHMSLLKNCFHEYLLPFQLLESRNVKLMLRACSLTMDFAPVLKGIFSLEILTQIIRACHILDQPSMYRCLFLLAFFGFLRISNLVPPSGCSFDPFRHLTRGDLIHAYPGLQLVVKWSKTIQSCSAFKTIPIATIAGSPLCPVAAFHTYTRCFPATQDHPMFYYYKPSGQITLLTEPRVRTALATILRALHLNPKLYTFHTFRHSGATLAYNLGVPMQDIQHHGTWISNAVWSYIQPTPTQTPVTQAFSKITSK